MNYLLVLNWTSRKQFKLTTLLGFGIDTMLMWMEKVHTPACYWLAVVFRGQYWLNLLCSWFSSFTDNKGHQLKFMPFCKACYVKGRGKAVPKPPQLPSFLLFSYIELPLEVKSFASVEFSDGLTASKVLGMYCCCSIHTVNLPAVHQQQRVRDVLLEVAVESAEESYHEPGESWSRCQKWRPRTQNVQGDQRVWRLVYPWQQQAGKGKVQHWEGVRKIVRQMRLIRINIYFICYRMGVP